MSNFTVSARKYRPGTFETVVGQKHVTQTLKNAIKNDHIGHSFLFCGPRGVGKTTCARILAKALNCQNLGEDGEPCGECQACLSFQTQQSFNIYELDAASNNSVEDIRSLTEQVRFGPQNGRYKIYIIDEVHMLSNQAFNAFLKTLEEPPSYAIFILATTEKHKIIPTILSRCQVFDFHRISISSIISHLKNICVQENIEAEEEGLYVIAQKADGALRDALSIFDRVVSFSGNKVSYLDVIENLNVLDYDYYFKVTDLALDRDVAGMLLLFNEILEKGFDGHNFLNGLSEHLRNLLVCRDPSTIKLLELSEGTLNLYLDQTQRTGMSFLLSGLNILNQFDVNYKASKNQRLHVELALMKLCHLNDILQLAETGSSPAGDEKKKPEPTAVKEKAAPVYEAATVAVQAAPAKPKGPRLGKLDALRNKVKQQRDEELNTEAKAVAEEPVEKADPERIKRAWQGYISDLKSRNKASLFHKAETISPEVNEEGVVLLKVTEVQRNLFAEDRMNWQNYLSGVKVEFIIETPSQEEEKKYITSDREKFNQLAEINPHLLEMQKRLGLRVDY